MSNIDIRYYKNKEGQTVLQRLVGGKWIEINPPTVTYRPFSIQMVHVDSGDISSDFLMSKYPITQKEYEHIMGVNPVLDNDKDLVGDYKPVVFVSWYEAVEFCNKLSKLKGLDPYYFFIDGKEVTITGSNGYRLPTEAEWEYAAKGGIYNTGTQYSGSNDLNQVGWYEKNCKNLQSVGKLNPNDLGLYDMSGNVWEWCWNKQGSCRVGRGGSWGNYGRFCRVAYRDYYDPDYQSSVFGFRICRTI